MNEWFSPQEQLARACPSNVQFSSPASLPAGLFANCEQEFQIARFPQRGQNSFVSRHSMQPARAQQPLHQGRKNESSASFLLALNYHFSSGVCNYPSWLCIAIAKTHQNQPPTMLTMLHVQSSSHAQWSRMRQLRTICLYTGSAFAWGANSWGWWYIMNHDSLCSWEGFLCSWKSRSWWRL